MWWLERAEGIALHRNWCRQSCEVRFQSDTFQCHGWCAELGQYGRVCLALGLKISEKQNTSIDLGLAMVTNGWEETRPPCSHCRSDCRTTQLTRFSVKVQFVQSRKGVPLQHRGGLRFIFRDIQLPSWALSSGKFVVPHRRV
jgi:hypothetical protein